MVSEILVKYVDGLNAGDAEQVANLFADKCDFNDGGARPFDFPDVVAAGKDGVYAAFKGVFETYKVVANIVKMNPNSMEYDVLLAGLTIPCIGTATLDKDGKITEYMVRPR